MQLPGWGLAAALAAAMSSTWAIGAATKVPAGEPSCVPLPAKFESNRIFLEVKTSAGDSLRFYTDSCGGIFPFVYDDSAKKLGMKVEKTIQDEGMTIGFSTFPESFRQQRLPLQDEWKSQVRIFNFVKNGRDDLSQSRFFLGDGFLGATFFAGRVWRFNYTTQTLAYCDSTGRLIGYQSVPMHFQTRNEKRTSHQPRVAIDVMGTSLPVLFDTGATSRYSPGALTQLRLASEIQASSFIRASVAKRWREMYPNWRYVTGGERFSGGGDLIEVPDVRIGTLQVGPVWFATRKDAIYDAYSKDIMDSRIDGAIGGNAFKNLELIADYPETQLHIRTAPQSH